VTLGAGALLWLLSMLVGGGDGIPSGSPPVVIVTVVDEVNYNKEYINMIKDNRNDYAKKHGKLPCRPAVEDLLNDPC
jgi:mannan polymerase II complex MNN11 subunit